MKAVLELEALGFRFIYEAGKWRGKARGQPSDPECARRLMAELRQNREEAAQFLEARSRQQCEVSGLAAGADRLLQQDDTDPQWVWERAAPHDAQGIPCQGIAARADWSADGTDGAQDSEQRAAGASVRELDDPPPTQPCRPFGTGEHRRFWRRPAGGWVCAICHPCPLPAGSVETWELPE